MKKGGAILIGVILIVAFSIGYHNYLMRKSVINDVEGTDVIEEERREEIQENEEKTIIENQPSLSGEKEMTSGEKTNTKEEKKEEEKKTTTKLEVVSNSYSNLSNEKCAWGFVRKSDGVQPEFYGPHAKVLDGHQGIYCGNKDNQVLYLTFDEGYENGYTASILDTLKEKGVKAAFFVTMPYVKQNPELVKRMIDEGHIVGNHTVNHPSMPEVTDNTKLMNEVMELHDYVVENFHYEMHYLRPPKGEYSERTVQLCLDLGYRNVLWSSAYADWDTNNQKGSDYAKKMIYNNFHNGSVMLLHAVSKDNATVLSDVIDEARNRGYTFMTLDQFEY